MKLGHIHLNVKDLEATRSWMEEVMDLKPDFENGGMAVFSIGELKVIFDREDVETTATLAIESESCDADFKVLISRGAQTLEAPKNQPWGVRTAYLQGPGGLTIEIEEITRQSIQNE